MTSDIFGLSPLARVQTVFQRISLGQGCTVISGGNMMHVGVGNVCPGKVVAQVAELTGIQDGEVKPLEIKVGGESRKISLTYAIEMSPGGCKSMFGGRETNLKMLEALLRVIIGKDNPQPPALTVLDFRPVAV